MTPALLTISSKEEALLEDLLNIVDLAWLALVWRLRGLADTMRTTAYTDKLNRHLELLTLYTKAATAVGDTSDWTIDSLVGDFSAALADLTERISEAGTLSGPMVGVRDLCHKALQLSLDEDSPPPVLLDLADQCFDVLASLESAASRPMENFVVEDSDNSRELRSKDDISNDFADWRLMNFANSVREDERRRLAREIHDGPAQVLTNAIYAIQIAQQIAQRAPDQVHEELSMILDLLKDGVSEIRRFMFDLRPTMLQDHGLSPTLRRYVEDYNRFFAKRIQLTVAEPLPALTPEQELTIFRIVQEALQNVHKHAGVEANATITLTHEESWLHLRIADTGRGFDPKNVVSRPGFGANTGLKAMRERARLHGATLGVESKPGEGTTVQLVLRLAARNMGSPLPIQN